MGKQRVIDTLYFRGLKEVKVLYDVDNQVFKARVFDSWMKATLLQDLKDKISGEVKRIVSGMYQWIPVIEVEETHSWSGGNFSCFVGFTVDRFYVTKRPDGKWMKSDWNMEGNHRSTACEMFKDKGFSIPSAQDSEYDDDRRTFYIPYTEAKWFGFQRLNDAINELKKRLRELIGTEEGQKKISEAGRLMLEWK
jgi:hypothetical protein